MVTEEIGGYHLVGIGIAPSGGHHITITDVSFTGEEISNTDFFLDTIYSFSQRTNQGMVRFQNKWFVFGAALDNNQVFHGMILNYDTAFSTLDEPDYLNLDVGTMLNVVVRSTDTSMVLGASLQSSNETIYVRYFERTLSGNVLWQQNFYCGPGNCVLVPHHILPLSDGGYIFTLKEEHLCPTLAIEDIRSTLIRTDSVGNELWRIWPGTDRGTYRSGPWTVQTTDGDLLFAYTDRYTNECLPQGNDTNTVRFVKIDLESGDMLWEKDVRQALPTVPNDSITGYAYDITQMETLQDGNILLVGTEGFKGLSIKLTEEAEHIWHRAYLPPGHNLQTDPGYGQKLEILGFSETSDGGFIMAGEYLADPGTFYPNGLQSAFALKVDSYGCLEPDCQLADTLGTSIAEAELPELNMYPNPATDVLHIEMVYMSHQISDIRIIDMLGRQFPLIKGVSRNETGDSIIEFNISNLPTGIYILTIQFDEGRSVSRKFVKQ